MDLDASDGYALLHRLVRQAKTVEVFQRTGMHDSRPGLLDRTGLTVHNPNPNSVPGQLQCCGQAARTSAYDKNVRAS